MYGLGSADGLLLAGGLLLALSYTCPPVPRIVKFVLGYFGMVSLGTALLVVGVHMLAMLWH
jgi:hypothetical protein